MLLIAIGNVAVILEARQEQAREFPCDLRSRVPKMDVFLERSYQCRTEGRSYRAAGVLYLKSVEPTIVSRRSNNEIRCSFPVIQAGISA